MELIDRSTWRYATKLKMSTLIEKDKNHDEEDDDELLCLICTEGLINPKTVRPCKHTFCESCLLSWLSHSHTCPKDRSPLDIENDIIEPQPTMIDILENSPIECDCGYKGIKRSHNTCYLLACGFDGCDWYGHELSGVNIHKKSCVHRDRYCKQCLKQEKSHQQECTFENWMLDWSPSLRFGMSPTDLARLVTRSDSAILSYLTMSDAEEIISFPCKYVWFPYFQCLHLFHRHIRLPSPNCVNPNSYVCFLFQENMGLRLISMRLYIRFPQTFERGLNDFLNHNGIAKHEVSIDRRRNEIMLAVGKNWEDSNEWNIEFIDCRFPARGGTRVHAAVFIE